MCSEPYHNVLRDEGFQAIGQLDYRLQVSVWWNATPQKLIQIVVITIGNTMILKGNKDYCLQSVTTDGETWARDIGQLHDFLEHHFPEVRISFSHFRDVPPALADAEVRRRLAVEAPTQTIPTVEHIAELQRELQAKQLDAQSADQLLSLLPGSTDLLTGYARQRTRATQHEIRQLEDRLGREQQRLDLCHHLQREYQRKGSAATYAISMNSNLHVAESPDQFRDAVRAIVKELIDQDRYQVRQRLQGSRLNIHVAPAEEPAVAWIEQWFGGALSPTQLARLGPTFNPLKNIAMNNTIVTPDEPIIVDGSVRHAEKHLAARIVSDVVRRLDKTDPRGRNWPLDPDDIPPEAMPLRLGHLVDDTGQVVGPGLFPLNQIVHAYISGTTGSGKSFLARAIIEEASRHENLSVLVLDPRNQFVGLLVAEDRPDVLRKYSEFEMDPKEARGFEFSYFAPGLSYAPQLPQKLSSPASKRSIISFKSMPDHSRCDLAAQILDALFGTISASESERPRLLLLVDEAQLFTRKRVDESAKNAAARAERALDRIAREGRKYGIVMALVSQTIRDFGYELASLRQMTTTRIFLRNSDREIEYATEIIGDGKVLPQLATGTAIVHNANWGVHRLRVRPPYSKVFELRESEIRRLVGDAADTGSDVPIRGLSAEAQRILSIIREHSAATPPLNLSRVAELAGITSRRRLHHIIAVLEHARVVRTRKLSDRGRPRVVELAHPTNAPLEH